jgi:hypothetical protein
MLILAAIVAAGPIAAKAGRRHVRAIRIAAKRGIATAAGTTNCGTF